MRRNNSTVELFPALGHLPREISRIHIKLLILVNTGKAQIRVVDAQCTETANHRQFPAMGHLPREEIQN